MRALRFGFLILLLPLALRAGVRCEEIFAEAGLRVTAEQARYVDELVRFQIEKDQLPDKDESWAIQEFQDKYKAALTELGPSFHEYYQARFAILERELRAAKDQPKVQDQIRTQRKRLIQPFEVVEHEKLSEWGTAFDATHRLALDQRVLQIYDLATQRMTPYPHANLLDPLSVDNPLVLGADRQTLFTTYDNQVIRLEVGGRRLKENLSHKTRWGFSHMTLTPDQKYLVLTGSRSEVYILDSQTLKEVAFFDLLGPLFLFNGDRHLAISKDSRYLFFITGRNARFVYDLQKRERRDLETLNKFPGLVQDAVFTAQPGRVILRCDQDQIGEYDFLNDRWIKPPSKANESAILVGSSDERYVVWGRRAREPDLNEPVLRLFDTQTQKVLPLPEGLEVVRETYRVESDGDLIFVVERRDVAGEVHNFIWTWDLRTMKVSSYEVPAQVDLASARHLSAQGPNGLVFKSGQRSAIELRAPADP